MNEARKHTRYSFEADVEIALPDTSRQTGRVRNISTGGTFVDTLPAPVFGSRVTLCLDLPGVPGHCSIPCIVRWVKDDGGTGLQFESLRPIEVWALNKLMHSLEKID